MIFLLLYPSLLQLLQVLLQFIDFFRVCRSPFFVLPPPPPPNDICPNLLATVLSFGEKKVYRFIYFFKCSYFLKRSHDSVLIFIIIMIIIKINPTFVWNSNVLKMCNWELIDGWSNAIKLNTFKLTYNHWGYQKTPCEKLFEFFLKTDQLRNWLQRNWKNNENCNPECLKEIE